MSKLYLILVLILTFSCSKKSNDNRITEFEKVLGTRQTNAFDLLVSDFENNLAKVYPDLSTDKGYEKYLIEIISDSSTDYNKFKFLSDKTNIEFHKSGLWNEIYEYSMTYDFATKDSIEMLDFNTLGKYMTALYKIKDSDSLIKKYWSVKEAAGIMQNEIVISGIMSSNPDFNNYFHKRIVVMELSY